MFLRKYGVATTIIFPVIKVAVQDFAISTDWTPATGDTKISKDGGNVANTGSNPAAVGGTGSALWSLALTATEMQAASIVIQIVDSATKTIEDQSIIINTYGHASAMHEFDLDSARVDVGSILGTAQTAGDVVANVVTILADYARRTGDYATVAALTAVDTVVDAILVDTGTDIPASIDALPTAAEVWASATRTLTQSAVQVAATVEGSEITVANYASITIALTGLGDLTGDTQIWFTVKELITNTDAEAILQIGYVGGLLYLNGAAPVAPIVAGDGALTIDSVGNGDITIALSFDAAALLAEATDLNYDIKTLDALTETITVKTTGKINIVQTITRALE